MSEEPKTASFVSLAATFSLTPRSSLSAGRQGWCRPATVSGHADWALHEAYGKLIVEGKFELRGFAAHVGFKDIRLVLGAADELRVRMPLASLVRV